MPADFWASATLGDLLSGLNSYVSGAIATLGQDSTKVSQTLASIQARVNAVTNFINTANSLFTKLQASGFYIITLPPGGPGSWATRLTTAAGAPLQGAFYTAGMCIIIEAPTLVPVIDNFTKMIDVITSPLPF